MTANKRRTYLSLALGLLLLGALIYGSGPKQFWHIIRELKAAWWVGAFFLYLMTQLISSLRWQILLKAERIIIPLQRLVTFYFAGMFFNLFLPGLVGGDLVRGYIVYREAEKKEEAAVSVVVERLCGMGALLTIGFVAMLISYRVISLGPVSWALSILMGFFLGLIFLASRTSFLQLPLKLLGWLRLPRWAEAATKVHQAFRLYGGHRKALLKAGALSFLLQTLGILVYYLLARALGLSVPIIYFFLFVPIITAVSMIPITFSSLGVREGISLLLFSKIGVSAPAAITLSLAWWVNVALLSLLATPLWARKGLI